MLHLGERIAVAPVLEHGGLFGKVVFCVPVGRRGRGGESVPVSHKALDALFGPCGYVGGDLLIGVDFHAYNVLKRSLKKNEIDGVFTFFLHGCYARTPFVTTETAIVVPSTLNKSFYNDLTCK
jgi:hypothetical protein